MENTKTHTHTLLGKRDLMEEMLLNWGRCFFNGVDGYRGVEVCVGWVCVGWRSITCIAGYFHVKNDRILSCKKWHVIVFIHAIYTNNIIFTVYIHLRCIFSVWLVFFIWIMLFFSDSWVKLIFEYHLARV